MRKQDELKRKHHYVWADYLKRWATGNDIYYISKKGIISQDSVKGRSCAKDFYKINLFNRDDIFIAKKLISMSEINIQKLHNNTLTPAFYLSMIKEKLGEKYSYNTELIHQEKVIRHNTIENYNTSVEIKAAQTLKQLATGDISPLHNKENFLHFCNFLGMQAARSKKMQDTLLRSSDHINGEPILINKIREFSKNHWWFIHCFFGINLGYDLYTNKSYEKSIIRNQTSLPFITSDHPVININPLGDKSEYIDYYYPISTEFALLITSSDNWKSIKNNITYDMVDLLNKKICEHSGDTIYSNSQDIIRRYKSDFNKRKIITGRFT